MTARTCQAALLRGQPYQPASVNGTCAHVARHAAPFRLAACPTSWPGRLAGAAQKAKRVRASTLRPFFLSRIHNLKRGADHVG